MSKKKQKTTTKGRRIGRTPKVHLDDVLQIRLSAEDHATWTARAEGAGMTLSQWIRFQCVAGAGGRARAVAVEFVTTYPVTLPEAQP